MEYPVPDPLDVEQVSIRDFCFPWGITVFLDSDDLYKAIDGRDGSVLYEDSSLSNVHQPAYDYMANNDTLSHLIFAPFASRSMFFDAPLDVWHSDSTVMAPGCHLKHETGFTGYILKLTCGESGKTTNNHKTLKNIHIAGLGNGKGIYIKNTGYSHFENVFTVQCTTGWRIANRLNESSFVNCISEADGTTTNPAMVIKADTDTPDDATNTLDFFGFKWVNPKSQALRIETDTSLVTSSIRAITFHGGRIHSTNTEASPSVVLAGTNEVKFRDLVEAYHQKDQPLFKVGESGSPARGTQITGSRIMSASTTTNSVGIDCVNPDESITIKDNTFGDKTNKYLDHAIDWRDGTYKAFLGGNTYNTEKNPFIDNPPEIVELPSTRIVSGVFDSWRDGRISQRKRGRTRLTDGTPTRFVKSPMEWNIVSGSPSASTGYLSLPAGDVTAQTIESVTPCLLETGRIEYEMAFTDATTTGAHRTHFLRKDANNLYELKLSIGTEGVELYRAEGGSYNLLGSGSFTLDTNYHTWAIIIPKDGNISVNFDGTEIISAGSATTKHKILEGIKFKYEGDYEARIKNLKIY